MLREVTSNQEKDSHRKATTALLYPSIRDRRKGGDRLGGIETGCIGLTMQVSGGELSQIREGSRINAYNVQTQ